MVTAENYHADTTHVSKSGLDKINQSPAHYFYHYLDPDSEKEDDTHAQIFGDAFHCAVLETHLFTTRFYVAPYKVDRRTKDGKETFAAWKEAAKGKKIISRDDYQTILKMRASIHANPICNELFKTGIREKVFTFKDPLFGVNCKIKPDWIYGEKFLMVDLKSCLDASPNGFRRSMIKFRYYVQNAFYSDGFLESTGQHSSGFVFVAVEKNPPYNLGLYRLDQEDIEVGRSEYISNLEIYKRCLESGHWPGYEATIQHIKIF